MTPNIKLEIFKSIIAGTAAGNRGRVTNNEITTALDVGARAEEEYFSRFPGERDTPTKQEEDKEKTEDTVEETQPAKRGRGRPRAKSAS